MEKLKRIQGRLLRKKPYKISSSGAGGKVLKTTLHEMSGARLGDWYYHEKIEGGINDGIILLIPKKLYERGAK